MTKGSYEIVLGNLSTNVFFLRYIYTQTRTHTNPNNKAEKGRDEPEAVHHFILQYFWYKEKINMEENVA